MNNLLLIASIFYTVFVIYGSLVPWQFNGLPLTEAWQRFQNIEYLALGIASRADWVANILLFIPLTFFWLARLSFQQQHLVQVFASVVVLIASFFLCTTIEFSQVFFPPRTVSLNDIAAESIGAVIGVLAWWTVGKNFISWLDGWQVKKTHPVPYLQIYLGCMFFYSVMPLDLTLSPVEFYHKWREGRVILLPFSGLKGDFFRNIYDCLSDIALWVPVPFLWLKLESSNKWVLLRKVFYAATAIEFFQLFVYSRVTDVTDVILAVIGGLVGVLLVDFSSTLLWSNAWKEHVKTPANSQFLYLWLAYFFWILIVAAVFWYPYDFYRGSANLAAWKDRFFRVPFYSYYYGTEYRAITEVFHKILFFIPFGVIIGFAASFFANKKLVLVICLLVISVTSLIIEFGQLFLINKNSDITDVILEVLGGYLGFVLLSQLVTGFNVARSFDSDLREEVVVLEYSPSDYKPGKSVNSKALNVNKRAMPNVLKVTVWLVSVIPVFGALLFAARSESVPYNVRELFSVEHPIFSALGIAILIYWCFAYWLYALMRVSKNNKLQVFFCIKFLVLHSLVAWLLVWAIIPVESIHDILGSPVLHIPAEIELLFRFLALFSIYSLMLLGATHTALFVVVENRQFQRLFFLYFIWLLILLPISYWVVVVEACTDNLTELLVNGGYSFRVLSICAYLFLVGWLGASLSLLAIYNGTRRVVVICFLLVLSFPIGYQLLIWGTEQFVVKYDSVFSAMQFLFSPDRSHLVSDDALKLRVFMVHAGLVFVSFVTQVPMVMASNEMLKSKKT